MTLALFVLFPLTVLLYAPLAFEEFESTKTLALVSFACFALFFVDWRKVLKDKVAFGLGLFTLSAGLSTIFSIDRHVSIYGNIKAQNGLLVTASYFVLYLALTQYITTFKDAQKLINIILCCSAFVALYGLLQTFGIDFQGWTGTLEADGYVRPISTLGHPNFMANYLAMTLPFAFWQMDRQPYPLPRVFYAGIILASLSAIFLALSRGMWLALALGMGVYFYRTKIFARFYKLGAVIAVIGSVCLAASPVFRHVAINRYENMFSPGPARTEYLKGALRIWEKYPIVGIGTDNYELGFQHQRTEDYWKWEPRGSPHRAHFDALNILACQGLIGALCAIFLTIAIFARAYKSDRSHFSTAAIASIVTFYAAGITSFMIISTGAMLILCLALLKLE